MLAVKGLESLQAFEGGEVLVWKKDGLSVYVFVLRLI
jgi:hypothetical protein